MTRSVRWYQLIGGDPRPWILSSAEPSARLLAAHLADQPAMEADLAHLHGQALADPGTVALIERLPDWETEVVISGHNSPAFAPNVLAHLWWLGLRGGDSPRVEMLLDQMLRHQDGDGRFQTLGRWRGQDDAVWGSLFCDSHAIIDVLVRFGRGDDERTVRAIRCMVSDVQATQQGPGWGCRPDPATGFRGPGRRADVCPQVTLEAVRALARWAAETCAPSLVPEAVPVAVAAAKTLCTVWQRRGVDKPYMFGHGRQFKRVKWPPMWYDAFGMVDALSMLPQLWRGQTGPEGDATAIAELAACLIAYNVSPDGRVTPRSCYRGFGEYSWGQKRQPSPQATAMICTLLRRIDDLSPQIRAVDVRGLASSKGGTGIALPP